jgi:hypothetical protein
MKNIENINDLARLRPFSVCCNWGDRTALGREAGDLAGTYQALLSPKTQGPARPSSLLGSLACGLSFPLKEILNLSDSLFPCLPSSSHASSNRVDRCSHVRRQHLMRAIRLFIKEGEGANGKVSERHPAAPSPGG